MEHLRSRRWNPGFIAMRWRHVFWILPMAGLLLGIAMQVVTNQRRNVAIGLVHVFDSPTFGFGDCLKLIESDEVLETTSRELDLPNHWKMTTAESVETLRRLVVCEHFPGTGLITISVRGKKTPETVRLCKAVIEVAERRALSISRSYNEEVYRKVEAELADRSERLASLQKKLDDSKFIDPSVLPDASFSLEERLRFIQSERDIAKRQRDELLSPLLSKSKPPGFVFMKETILAAAEFPTMTSIPTPFWEKFLGPALFIGICVGVGGLLSVILAYLLELVFPRKRVEEIPSSV